MMAEDEVPFVTERTPLNPGARANLEVVIANANHDRTSDLKILLKIIATNNIFHPLEKLGLFTQFSQINRALRHWVDHDEIAMNTWVNVIIPHVFEIDTQTIQRQESILSYRVRFNNTILLNHTADLITGFMHSYQHANSTYTHTCQDKCFDFTAHMMCQDYCLGSLCPACSIGNGCVGGCIFGGINKAFWACCVPSTCGLMTLTTLLGMCAVQGLNKAISYRVIEASDRDHQTNLVEHYQAISSRIERESYQSGHPTYFTSSVWSLRKLMQRFSFYHPGNLGNRFRDLDCVPLRAGIRQPLSLIARESPNEPQSPAFLRME